MICRDHIVWAQWAHLIRHVMLLTFNRQRNWSDCCGTRSTISYLCGWCGSYLLLSTLALLQPLYDVLPVGLVTKQGLVQSLFLLQLLQHLLQLHGQLFNGRNAHLLVSYSSTPKKELDRTMSIHLLPPKSQNSESECFSVIIIILYWIRSLSWWPLSWWPLSWPPCQLYTVLNSSNNYYI